HNLINDYLSGTLSVYEQLEFFPFCGPNQITKTRELLDSKPDLVFVHRLVAMLPVIRSSRRPVRMFFDLDDLEHRTRIQGALERRTWPRRIAQLLRVPAVIAAERKGASL